MSLLIQNADVITADSRFQADLLCENGRISAIGNNLEVTPHTRLINAKGKWVFPGAIDPHVHVHMPFMGTFAKDDYPSASRAALCGGTTTIIEMICPPRSMNAWEGYQHWKSLAEGHSACDFSFHMGISRFDAQQEIELRRIVEEGITSFKVFLAYKGAFGIDDSELYQTLKLAKELNVIVTAHCENETLIAERQQQLLAEGRVDPAQHYHSRPPQVEALGVDHLMTFAELTGARTYIVHLSCKEALERALAARQRGVNVSIETLIQHLLLDKTYAELPGYEGAKYVMSPPLRDRSNQDILWKALQDGSIQTVATDHCPFDFQTQKQMGREDFTKIPNGLPTLEDRFNLLYTYGVKAGKLDLHQLVACTSTNVAKQFDLFPRKGTIQVGADADLILFDPEYQGTISAKTHHMNVDYSVYEGWALQGRVETVILRGEIAVQQGEFVGSATAGQFLRRQSA